MRKKEKKCVSVFSVNKKVLAVIYHVENKTLCLSFVADPPSFPQNSLH